MLERSPVNATRVVPPVSAINWSVNDSLEKTEFKTKSGWYALQCFLKVATYFLSFRARGKFIPTTSSTWGHASYNSAMCCWQKTVMVACGYFLRMCGSIEEASTLSPMESSRAQTTRTGSPGGDADD